MNKYLIKEDTLNQLASMTKILSGKETKLTPNEIIEELTKKINLDKAFYENDSDLEFINPYITRLGFRAFNYQQMLTKVECINLTELREDAVRLCTNLNTIILPKCIILGPGSLYGPNNLTSVSFENVITVDRNVFRDCSLLTYVNLPKAESIGANSFNNCNALESLELPSATYIGTNAFNNCNSLKYIVLSNNSICSLGAKLFNASGLGPSFEAIYVPDNLVEQYKVATNWANIDASYFKPLSEL